MIFKSKINFVVAMMFGLLLVLNNISYAQRQGGPTAEEMISKMQQDLDLSDEQAAQIKPIIEEENEKMKSLMEQMRKQGDATSESIRTEIEKIRQETETKLVTYLSEEQMSKWKEQKEKRMLNHGNRGQGKGFRPPPDH